MPARRILLREFSEVVAVVVVVVVVVVIGVGVGVHGVSCSEPSSQIYIRCTSEID